MKKAWLITACAVMILAVSLVGTFAYLTDTAEPVKNTFTVGKLLDDPLSFVLKEHKAEDVNSSGVYVIDSSVEVDANAYTILPGVNLPKDPFVKTTEELQLDAYVFVEVVDGNVGANLHYTVDSSAWSELADTEGPNGGKVYVRAANGGIVEAGAKLGPVYILEKNTVIVANADITESAAIDFGGELSFYGYMIQAGGFDSAVKAWAGFGFGGDN